MEAEEELHYHDKAEEELRGRKGWGRQGRESRRLAVGEPGGNGAGAVSGLTSSQADREREGASAATGK